MAYHSNIRKKMIAIIEALGMGALMLIALVGIATNKRTPVMEKMRSPSLVPYVRAEPELPENQKPKTGREANEAAFIPIVVLQNEMNGDSLVSAIPQKGTTKILLISPHGTQTVDLASEMEGFGPLYAKTVGAFQKSQMQKAMAGGRDTFFFSLPRIQSFLAVANHAGKIRFSLFAAEQILGGKKPVSSQIDISEKEFRGAAVLFDKCAVAVLPNFSERTAAFPCDFAPKGMRLSPDTIYVSPKGKGSPLRIPRR